MGKGGRESKPKLAIWGASGHALVVADIVRLQGVYELIGFIDDVNPEKHGMPLQGVTVLGGREILDQLLDMGITNIILGFGDCKARLRLSDFVLNKGFTLATVIHPQSVIASDVSIGQGTVIVAGSVINPGSEIGNNVIINTCSSIDHNCIVSDGVHIAPGVHIGGEVYIGQGSFVGIGTSIKDHIRIGENTLIGAGSVVICDIPSNVVAYGNPARIQKRRTP